MFRKITIKDDERGLLFKKGSYVKRLQPGVYRHMSFSDESVVIQHVAKRFSVPNKELQLFLHDEQLTSELTIADVQDYEYVLHFEDGKFNGLLTAGLYAFWNVMKKHTFIRVDIRNPEISEEIDRSLLGKLQGYMQTIEVASYETGLLFYNNALQSELRPGRYFFWKGPTSVQVKTLDLRQLQLDMTGQEIMTEDKVTLRLNFVCQYKVVDPIKAIQIKGFEDQVYILLQLILREYVGTLKLDDLLRMKQEIAAFVLSRLNEQKEHYGVQFISAGLKDIILPGDVKDILNTVLLAEKKAQANLITRREETASTRSLLNTAKLMDENGTLYRLKELEFLEKICEKIGNISLTGGGNLLEHLNSLLTVKNVEK
ncbi:regulator of protease activity HflC (stomatin/prohibitin superfamily) [Paenibacillus endophyticus]|uniref:Regulator of protease activity HflC (Stomatin/prohibitin superfamily) n=1 Tax=Paenibacillus endophyticus TaxID=1294268 RepID=A0A7W5CEM2_9BACL|nr:slipin family protein [Paenibacillus endophyticus]MBB3156256.1 regulator of protease activity HflC (stomatin/prohibitin superfamily) [Paenibacillus endophyticus]